MKRRRIIINNDFYNIFQVEPPVTDDDVYAAVDRVAGTQVDALFMMLPSTLGVRKEELLDDDLVRLYEHPETDPCIANLDAFCGAGKDPFGMLLERARQKGLEFFGSLRMNDTHYLDQDFNPWVPSFYYDNLHNRIEPAARNVRAGTEFDYRKSVVRERLLGIIREAFSRYDLDGLEMDLTRNCKFVPGEHPEECAPVMTQFVRQVRRILDEFGGERQRKLFLCATVPCSLNRARKEGLDIPLWARLRLIDMLVMSTPFEVDFERDIHDTKLKVPGLSVHAGCDRNLPGWPLSRVVPKEAYRAMAMNYLRQGADGVYLYNVMAWTMDMTRQPVMLKMAGGQGEVTSDAVLMNELGDPSTLQYLDKLYLVSHGKETADKPYASLPVTVPAGGEVTLRMTIGDDVAKAAAQGRLKKILLQTVSSDCDDYDNYTVKLNQIDLSRQYAFLPYATKPDSPMIFPEAGRSGALPPLERVRRHPVRPIDLHPGVSFITVKSYRDPLTITDIELGILYR